jgi:hypothetical protein
MSRIPRKGVIKLRDTSLLLSGTKSVDSGLGGVIRLRDTSLLMSGTKSVDRGLGEVVCCMG